MEVIYCPGKALYLDRVEMQMLKEVLQQWLISELTCNYKYKTMLEIYGRICLNIDKVEGGAAPL